jgi:hypothetical protein
MVVATKKCGHPFWGTSSTSSTATWRDKRERTHDTEEKAVISLPVMKMIREERIALYYSWAENRIEQLFAQAA